jgi:hypothetical protein
MDLYQKNPIVLRKLLAKRQNPCTKIFKSQQLSNTTNHPNTKVNLLNQAIFRAKAGGDPYSYSNSTQKLAFFSRNTLQERSINNFSSRIQKAPTHTENVDENGDSFERIQKKVKYESLGKCTRKESFEEEKEVSDHSTACDTHSDGNLINEVGDFAFSPILTSQSPQEPVMMKLDDDETPLKNGNSFITISSTEDVFAFRTAQNQAERLGGSCLSCNYLSDGKLKFKCKLRHQWEMTMEELKQRWCPKCEELLRKCKLFANENGGVCLNERFEETLDFACFKGHQWSINYKSFNSRWCLDCAKEAKDFLKKKCEEERKRREKMEEECQKKLFEEARRKAMNNIGNQQMSEEDILAYFQKVDSEVEALAKKNTLEFMSKKEICKNITYQQALQVYKILIMPEDVLQKYMMNLSPDILRSEFRRIAKIIHPDKNKHPNAKSAFQKIHKVYEAMVGRSERSQKI